MNHNVTPARYDAQMARGARRLPELRVPNRPSGVAGVYDVADDWTPIYDLTDAPGFYVAIAAPAATRSRTLRSWAGSWPP